MAYVFRGRDRRILAQTARDLALCIQRDIRTFNLKKTTELSTRITFFSGYYGTYPNIEYTAGSQVASALLVLNQLVADLASGSYGPSPNPDIVPPASITWPPILAAYYDYSMTVQEFAANKGLKLPDLSGSSKRGK